MVLRVAFSRTTSLAMKGVTPVGVHYAAHTLDRNGTLCKIGRFATEKHAALAVDAYDRYYDRVAENFPLQQTSVMEVNSWKIRPHLAPKRPPTPRKPSQNIREKIDAKGIKYYRVHMWRNGNRMRAAAFRDRRDAEYAVDNYRRQQGQPPYYHPQTHVEDAELRAREISRPNTKEKWTSATKGVSKRGKQLSVRVCAPRGRTHTLYGFTDTEDATQAYTALRRHVHRLPEEQGDKIVLQRLREKQRKANWRAVQREARQ